MTFELFRDDAGCYRFYLKSAIGEVLAVSDAYPTRAAVEDAIESIRHSAATAFVDDKTQVSVLEGRSSTAVDVAGYVAEHHVGPPRGRPRGINRLGHFDHLEEAKQACDRWQRSECRQAIVDLSTGERWIRIDDDCHWNPV